ncbi:MAG: hypothetical protein PHI68_06065, partial [Candidatus Cloacimonetes bacterium]|nr:hypothetical protein [Candidatus Cloacimonadota bacterium]
IYVSGDSNGTVTLDNVNIHDCPWTGLNILDKSITLNYSNLSITDCGRPIAIPPNLLNFLDEQPLFTDNTDNRIFLHSDGYLNRDTTVRDWGYPYVCESINIDVNYANLIINPGCEFQMGYSQGFNVTGSISAVGTSTDPILFNRLPGSTQNWRGFYLNSGTSYAHFDHCILQNCASSNQYSHIQDAFTIYRADTVLIENTQIIDAYCRAVYIESNDSDNDDLVINNLSVDGCGMDAVYQSASGYNLTINGLSVNSCNAFPLSLSANWAHQISGITLTNNAHNVIRFVYGGSLASQTLANHGYPYQISGGHLYVNYTNVTLLPGTVFYFELEKGLEISGTLNATGTPDQPIVFDRPPGATYFWERIYLSNNASASFANCQFLNCGRRNPNGYDNAFLDNAGGALLSLQNCLISNVDAQAISCHDGGSGDTTQINNVQINGCRTDGFLCNDSDYTLSVNNLSVTSCLRNPISILACQAGWIDNLTLNGNANNDIRLFDYNGISGTVHFPNHGYVYRCESGIMGIGGSNVSFAPGCIFWISDNRDLSFYGAVSAIGTAAQPIIFTRNPASTGNWLGVRLYNGNWDANFVYCQILYGGQNDTYNQCRAFSNYGCDNLNVSSCLIRYSPGEGMYFENMAASDVVNINNLTIRDVAWNGIIGDNIHYHDFTVNGLNLVDVGGYPIYFSADLLDRFSGVTFSGIGNPNIYVSSYTQTRSATWPGFGYPFRLKSSFTVNYSTTLTIPAGSELQWPDNSAFYVYGAIQAVGTEAQPIVFTRYPASTGYWQGICLHSGCWDADFVYCQILYGGQIDAYNKRRALGDYGCDNLNLNNSLIRYSYGDGIYFENMQAGDVVSINELTMRDIAWSGYVGPYIAYHNLSVNGLHFIDLGGSPINVPPDLLDRFAGVTFSGIGDPKIYVSSYPQSRSATWPNFGLPYYFNNSFSVNDWVTLTISAGTELVFANYILYEVNTNFIVYGALNTLGTEAQPVIFRGLDPNLPSTWVGLRFENPDYPCNLNYTTVMNAGLDENHTYAHEYCALYINGGSVNLSGCRLAISNHNLLKLDGNNSTTLSNCLLDSAVNGIIHNQGILNLYNNNIMALSGTGIFQNGGTLNFGTNPGQWNRLYGNTLNLRNNTAAIVNAPYIYWGSLDPDPIDALIWDNEEGSTVVNYEPWYDVNCLQLNYYSLDTPTGFAVGQQTPTTLRLSWNAVPAATSYKVLTAQDPYAAEWTILQQNISGTQIDLDINPALGKCFYKVVAER